MHVISYHGGIGGQQLSHFPCTEAQQCRLWRGRGHGRSSYSKDDSSKEDE